MVHTYSYCRFISEAFSDIQTMDVERGMAMLQNQRSTYIPQLPPALESGRVRVLRGETATAAHSSDAAEIRKAFPLTHGQPLVEILSADTADGGKEEALHPLVTRVGVAFSSAGSPGSHNVVAGIFEALKAHNHLGLVFGFVGGIEGLLSENTVIVTEDLLISYRNQGGCDLLGETTMKIRSSEHLEQARISCTNLNLDGLVLIGGCRANTSAAQLAEYFKSTGCQTKVVGVPVTLEGDLRNNFVETNVGFDTVCKVNSQLIGNICIDALSAGKYYFFIRVMGKKASHIALECTLQSRPNLVILAEDVAASNMTLSQLTNHICDVVQARADKGKSHGVILLPEGLLQGIGEMQHLLKEMKGLLRKGISTPNISLSLSPRAASLFKSLPSFFQRQLLQEMETEGCSFLSRIETEKLLAKLVEEEMGKRKKAGIYTGKKLDVICHFFGYQSRGALPSNFDCNYGYALGQIALYLVANGLNGYMATITNLNQPVSGWSCGAVPITVMMTIDRWPRDPNGLVKGKLAVHAERVNLEGKACRLLLQHAPHLLMGDIYTNLGPIQYQGPGVDSRTMTLLFKDEDHIGHP